MHSKNIKVIKIISGKITFKVFKGKCCICGTSITPSNIISSMSSRGKLIEWCFIDCFFLDKKIWGENEK